MYNFKKLSNIVNMYAQRRPGPPDGKESGLPGEIQETSEKREKEAYISKLEKDAI